MRDEKSMQIDFSRVIFLPNTGKSERWLQL